MKTVTEATTVGEKSLLRTLTHKSTGTEPSKIDRHPAGRERHQSMPLCVRNTEIDKLFVARLEPQLSG